MTDLVRSPAQQEHEALLDMLAHLNRRIVLLETAVRNLENRLRDR